MNQRIRAGQPLASSGGSSGKFWLVIALVLIALGAGGWCFWQKIQVTDVAVPGPTNTAPSPLVTPPSDVPRTPTSNAEEPLAAEEPTEPEPLNAQAPQEPDNLIDQDSQAIDLPPLQEANSLVATALANWLGKDKAYTFIQSDGFVRRFVATVDNLPRNMAPTQVWPLNPTSPKFEVDNIVFGQNTHIAATNVARYKSAVQFAQSLDMAQAARQYKQYYPLFQQAYEDLGYPDKYFNDRLITVIDHLLQAPEPVNPEVHLVQVKGEVPTQQPWVRYEFVDPQLEALSAGQKVLVRIGVENQRTIKAQLRAFKAQIAN